MKLPRLFAPRTSNSKEISSLPEPVASEPGARTARARLWTLPVLWRVSSSFSAPASTALAVALFIALALTPQVLNFARRDDFKRFIVGGAVGWQILESTEGRLLDTRFVERGPITPRNVDKLAIVAIDQLSLDDVGRWPWPRRLHARLIRRLKQAGASVIVFDVNFSDKQSPGAHGELSRDDKELVAASAAAGNVLFSTGFQTQRIASMQHIPSVSNNDVNSLQVMTTPFEELDATTADIGFNLLPVDSFGRTRRYAWRAHTLEYSLPSLAGLAVGMQQRRLDGGDNTRFLRDLARGHWPDTQGVVHPVPLSEYRLAQGDGSIVAWTTPIFFWGLPGTVSTYSYTNVLHGLGQQWTAQALRAKFAGRIVFIGGTSSIFKDFIDGPAFERRKSDTAQIPGVEIHAGIAAQMLDGRYLYTQSTASTWGCLLLMCVGSALWMSLLRSPVSILARRAQGAWSKRAWPGRIHSVLWFVLYGGLGALPVVGFWRWAQWELNNRDTWIITVYPLLGGFLSALCALMLFFVDESSERRKVTARFGRHVSPDVLEDILSRPEEVDIEAQRREISVLFSDLEGFTTFSESHSASEVIEALNDYMTRMVGIVNDHGGSLDKFIGDAVMVFFGAPIPRYDHAAQALACAVAMQEECARFRRETGIEFYIRVGVHSGEAIVGYVGSHARGDYSVIGDTVNLASRLEAKNKELGTRILCSGETYALAQGIVEASPKRVSIKGMTRQVEVWGVVGIKGLPPTESWDSLPASQAPDQIQSHEAPALETSEEELPVPLPAPLPALMQAPPDQSP
jgi:adenylate cyclase